MPREVLHKFITNIKWYLGELIESGLVFFFLGTLTVVDLVKVAMTIGES